MRKLIRVLAVILSVILAGTGLYSRFFPKPKPQTIAPEAPAVTTPVPQEERQSTNIPVREAPPTDQVSETARKITDNDTVPFIVQAPNAQWGNPIFQDGCEEASMLMAMDWIKGTKSVSATEAAAAITKLAAFETENLGHYEDVSLREVVSVLEGYFDYDRAVLLEDITLIDIRRNLDDGNIMLVPTFGQALHNPNYTAPGPVTHMLVITGYDPEKREFIVNDPGTRRGKDYRYDEDLLYEAIWVYPAGKTHPPVPAPADRQKSVIVIHPVS
ncbi:MAG: hypothetical protein HGA31_05670 [Candidatus Moranbacteria bacterium]|nr:hypothetical protein [Candidatus Moranbacteria bacterium]